MTDSDRRPPGSPLLLVGLLLVLILGIVAWMFPLAGCPDCHGKGQILGPAAWTNMQDPTPDPMMACPLCSGRGRVPVVTWWKNRGS